MRRAKFGGMVWLAAFGLAGCQPKPASVYYTWEIEEGRGASSDPGVKFYHDIRDTATLTIHDDRLAVLNVYGPKDSITRVNGGIHREGDRLHISFPGTEYPPLDLVFEDGKLVQAGEPPLVFTKGGKG